MLGLAKIIRAGVLAGLALALAGTTIAVAQDAGEKRFGLVIGNAEYASGTLPTAHRGM